MARRIATHPGKITGFSAGPGRPASTSNYGKYYTRPSARTPSGFTMPNNKVEAIEMVKKHLLGVGEMPMSLSSNRIIHPPIPAVLRKRKNESISSGFLKQKSFQG